MQNVKVRPADHASGLSLPLSPAQLDIWVAQRLVPDSVGYNIAKYVEIRDRLDPAVFERAVRQGVAETDSLWAVFADGLQGPRQYFPSWDGFDFPVVDFSGAADPVAASLAWMRGDKDIAFDLRQGPLFRFALLLLGNDVAYLYLVAHHLVTDGFGSTLFERRVAALYRGLAGGVAVPAGGDASMAGLIDDEDAYAGSERFTRDRAFWLAELEGCGSAVTLSGHAPAWPGGLVQNDRLLSPAGVDQLETAAAAHGGSLAALIIAAAACYIYRMTGAGDIVLGMPVTARTSPRLRRNVGAVSNVVPLRLPVHAGMSFAELVNETGRRIRAALRHQRYRTGDIRRDRGLAPGASDLFGTVVNFIPVNDAFSFAGGQVREHYLGNWRVEDLLITVDAGDRDAGLRIGLTANDAHYDTEALDRHVHRFVQLIQAAAAAPGLKLHELPIMGREDRDTVLRAWSGAGRAAPAAAALPALFEAQVARTPDAVAVVLGDDSLTYAALNRRANGLARRLMARGAGPERIVALCAERSLDTVVGLLAILKAGAAYLPLDPAYPASRLAMMLADARPVLLLASRAGLRHMPADIPHVVLDAADGDEAGERDDANPSDAERAAPLTALHPAYVIYTSGSTGVPKGVVVTHAGMAALSAAHVERFAVTQATRILQVASLSFDSSVADLVTALTSGAALVLTSRDALGGAALRRVLADQRITHATLTPTTLATLQFGGDLPLECLVVAGEACPDALMAQWSQRYRLLNAYGPTETTVCATMGAALDGGIAPIGTPLTGARVYVLDNGLEPVPVGAVGEVYIAGAGVARGYLHRPALTAVRFVADPYGPPGGRMYRSGDLARWRNDGQLEFAGRADHQVKIRGMRVELGEIEAVLAAQPGIMGAAVAAHADGRGGTMLVAYLVGGEAQAGDTMRLRNALGAVLPGHMVPQAFVMLAALPLTPNGKLDRGALPAAAPAGETGRIYEAPRGPREMALAAIWAELLQTERIGRNDHFFALGGHSLLAISLIERLRQIGWHCDARQVFARPVLADFAAIDDAAGVAADVPANRIDAGSARITPDMLPLAALNQSHIDTITAGVPGGAGNIQDIYPLAPLQEGIFFHCLMSGEADTYVLRALLAFDDRGRLDRFLAALQDVIDRHDVLRSCVLWENLPEPVQVVWRRAVLPVDEITVQGDDRAVETRLCAGPVSDCMDLRRAPLMHATIAHGDAGHDWLLVLRCHHLSADHVTLDVILAEVRAHMDGQPRREVAAQAFRNYVAASRSGAAQAGHEAFFRDMLAGVDEPTEPFGLRNLRGDGVAIGEARLAVDAGLARRLRDAARRLGVGPASLFHLAWGVVLARTSARDDVVFGTVLFGRMQGAADAARGLGLFINTLPLRLVLRHAPVAGAVLETHARLARLLTHEHASLAMAQRCSALPPGTALFSALLNYRYAHGTAAEEKPDELLPGVRLLHAEERTNYPCALSVNDLGGGFDLLAQSAAPEDPAVLCRYMHTVLEQLAAALEHAPSSPVRQLGVLDAGEQAQLLRGWNVGAPAPAPATLTALFEAQVARTPDAVAVSLGGDSLTYAALNRRANVLARRLIARGVAPGHIVGVAAQRTPEVIAALLAVLKAGGAFLPLDPAYPAARLRMMLEDARPVLVLAGRAAGLPLPEGFAHMALDDAVADAKETGDDGNPGDADRIAALTPLHPAYVIYTSGSTGLPKGVVVSHEGIAPLAASQVERLGVTRASRVLQFASLNFDASVWDLVMALTSGATLVLAPPDALSGEALRNVLVSQRISHALLPPAVLATLRHGDDLALACLVVGGEACPDRLIATWTGLRLDLINAYGPTEATVCAVMSARLDHAPAPIGRPLTGTRVYVLDSGLDAVPVGCVGELYIAGSGLALGYLHRPALTAGRFVADPYGPPGSRMYRSGDLARWRDDGVLEFVGRADLQVKIRGMRVEPAEIEAALTAQPGITQAAVIACDDGRGGVVLVAYLVCTGAGGADPARLRIALGALLPDHMVPYAFVTLPALPLTPSGKLDRAALQAPELWRTDVAPAAAEPQTETERRLAASWRDILRLAQVGRSDDFFELGGHSLTAMQVVARVREVFDIELPLKAVFECGTLASLAERIDVACAARVAAASLPPIVAAPPGLAAPLSQSQERMWLIQSLDPGTTAYNMAVALRMDGPLDAAALARAFDEVCRRHESLRTVVTLVEGRPVQSVAPFAPRVMAVSDVRGGADPWQAAMGQAEEDARTPFDLTRGPLIRARLSRVAPDTHVMSVVLHHIAGDQWSIGIIGRELAALYNRFLTGEAGELAAQPISYRDYAVWERSPAMEAEFGRQLAYWRRQLTGLPALELPTDRPRPRVPSLRGTSFQVPIEEALIDAIERLGRGTGSTAFMVMLAAFALLLHRITGQSDIAIGVPVANRSRQATEALVGTFVNTLVMRIDVSGNPAFSTLQERVRAVTLDAFANQTISFDRLVQELGRDAGRAPLAQVLFNVTNAPMHGIAFDGVSWAPVPVDRGGAQFEFSLGVDASTTRSITVEYNSDLFDRATVERWVGQYFSVLEAVATTPAVRLGDIGLLPRAQAEQLRKFNDTAVPHDLDTVFARLFEAQAARSPAAPAVSFDGATLDYAALNRRANVVARRLQALGVGAGVLVGVCLQRSLDLPVALLGIQKSGGAYVPLDPDFPAERLRAMLADSGASVLVIAGALPGALRPPDGVRVLDIAGGVDAESGWAQDNLAVAAGPHDVAYVIYTSGSTGRPKGVAVPHRALTNFLLAMRRVPGMAPDDVLAAVTTMSFDIAALELYLPLLVGARLELVAREVAADGRALSRKLEACGATVMQATPSTWRMLVEAGWQGRPGFRALSGGEALPRELADAVLCRVGTLWNLYGPTETTVWSTAGLVEPGSDAVSIGRPIDNTQVHVMDQSGAVLAAGIAGEICIGGAGVALGYLNRPELTAERFVPDAQSVEPGARLYRTGDLGRWGEDGRLYHLGRLDNQVKIRGFRIEPGEIEAALCTHKDVRQAVVVAAELPSGDQRLVAYAVYRDGNEPTASELRRFLRRNLPEYMIPSTVMRLDAVPLTPNGKLDRAALPDPFRHAVRAVLRHEAPASAAERMMADIWRSVLNVDRVNADDNFFEIGGHSLLALRVAQAVEARSGQVLDPRSLFFHTLRQVAAMLEPEGGAGLSRPQ
jgi:amino acid adenylation domain-containing protein